MQALTADRGATVESTRSTSTPLDMATSNNESNFSWSAGLIHLVYVDGDPTHGRRASPVVRPVLRS